MTLEARSARRRLATPTHRTRSRVCVLLSRWPRCTWHRACRAHPRARTTRHPQEKGRRPSRSRGVPGRSRSPCTAHPMHRAMRGRRAARSARYRAQNRLHGERGSHQRREPVTTVRANRAREFPTPTVPSAWSLTSSRRWRRRSLSGAAALLACRARLKIRLREGNPGLGTPGYMSHGPPTAGAG